MDNVIFIAYCLHNVVHCPNHSLVPDLLYAFQRATFKHCMGMGHGNGA